MLIEDTTWRVVLQITYQIRITYGDKLEDKLYCKMGKSSAEVEMIFLTFSYSDADGF